MASPAAEQAFLQPILAHYADDTPRLIYADFLEESDRPADRGRGELIRIQCALARLPADHPRRPVLVNQEADLLRQFQDEWTETLRGLAIGFEWRRGLLDSVTVEAHSFLANGAELLRRTPIRRIRLLEAAGYIERLAACSQLGQIRELDLCGNDLGNGGVNLLLRSRYLDRVQELDLSFNGLGDGALQLLAQSQALPRLRSLALSDNGSIGGEGVRFLSESSLRGELRALDVSGNDVSEVGIRAVVASPHLSRLYTIRLFANHIGDTGTTLLAESALLRRLLARNTTLDLRQNGIGAAGALALANSPLMARVEALNLTGNYLGSEGVQALAASTNLHRLRTLALRRNQIGDAGAMALAISALMPRLLSLDMADNRLTRPGVDALWNARGDFRMSLETSGNLVSTASEQFSTLSETVRTSQIRLSNGPPPIGTVLRPEPAARPK